MGLLRVEVGQVYTTLGADGEHCISCMERPLFEGRWRDRYEKHLISVIPGKLYVDEIEVERKYLEILVLHTDYSIHEDLIWWLSPS
jgi:hypothetical protein